MMDHNVLKDEITSANRYRRLQDLRLTIGGLKRKFPLSISSELEARVTEKLRTFDYPICSIASVRIIFSNGLSKDLEPDECQKAMARGMKLSDYIFSRYISARDFEIGSTEILGSRNFGVYSDEIGRDSDTSVSLTAMTSSELKEKVDFPSEKA